VLAFQASICFQPGTARWPPTGKASLTALGTQADNLENPACGDFSPGALSPWAPLQKWQKIISINSIHGETA
jgi:hypothetical protein